MGEVSRVNILDWKVVRIDDAYVVVYAHGTRYESKVEVCYVNDLINDVKKYGEQHSYTSTEKRMELVAHMLKGLCIERSDSM
jgi:hypothetical protein